MRPIETPAAVQRLLRFANDRARAARIARLARSVGEKTGDDFFKYLAYAVETHADGLRGGGPRMFRERDSLISTAFAQAAPR